MTIEVPTHIGFIPDGNRRWAKKHGLPAYEGHLAGYNAIHDVVTECFKRGVTYISFYIFSTENWKRSEEEVGKLMGIVLRLLTSDLHLFIESNIRLKILGSKDNVSTKILNAIDEAERKTADNTAGTLAVCFNYGGQLELADTVSKIIRAKIPAASITPEVVGQYLYAPEIPPLDLVVRTSGEKRTSNFMLWRTAYSELMFLEDKHWPDMTKDDVDIILDEYARRARRFGG